MTITLKVKNGTLIEGESLCHTCRYSHIQKGYRESEEAIFCEWTTPFRVVPFKVADCTDYANKLVPSRVELEKMALLINVNPVRKPFGFRNGAGFAADNGKDGNDDCVSSME